MNNALLSLWLVCSLTIVKAQNFKKTISYPSNELYSSTEGGAIFQTSDNHILILGDKIEGNSVFTASIKTVLGKYDLNGNLISSIEFSELISMSSTVATFLELSNGDYILTSGVDSEGGIIRLDPSLNILWSKYYGDKGNGGFYYDRLVNTIETSDGNLISIGTSGSLSNGQASLFVIKTDMNGNILWDKTFGFGGDEDGADIIEINNKYYAVGYGTGLFGGTIPMIIKLKENGTLEWVKAFNGAIGGGNIRSIFSDNNENIILVYEDSYHSVGNISTKSDIYVSVVDTNFTTNYRTKRYGFNTYNKIFSTELDSNSNMYISGQLDYDTSYRYTSLLDENIPFILKLNSLGDVVWCKVFEDNDVYQARFLQSSLLNNLIVNGDNIYLSYCVDSINDKDASTRSLIAFNKLDADSNNDCGREILFPELNSVVGVQDFTSTVDILSGGVSDSLFLNEVVGGSVNVYSDCYELSNLQEIDIFDYQIYPNPVNLGSEIYFDSKRMIDKVFVYDLNGKIHYRYENILKYNFAITDFELESGVYFVRVFNNQGIYQSKRLIIH